MDNNQIDELTLSDILKIFKKRKLWFWAVFILTILATGVYLYFFATPIYEVSTKVKIPARSGASSLSSLSSLSGAAALILGGSSAAPGISDQIEIIKSRKTLTKVIEQLNLLEYFRNKVKDEEAKKNITINYVISTLQEEIITVEPLKDTSFIEIKVSLDDKELAYKISKTLIDAYTEVSSELNKDENTYMIEFIEKQLPVTEKELAEIEEKLKNFKQTKSVLPSKEAELLLDALSEIDKQYFATKIQYQETLTKLDELKKSVSDVKDLIEKLKYIPNSPIIASLREKLTEYQIEYNALLQKYSEDSVEVSEYKARIEEAQKRIQQEVKNIISSQLNTDDPILSSISSELVTTQSSIEILKASLNALLSLKTELENQIKKLPEIEQEYLSLQRDYQLKQSAYVLLKSKLEEAKLTTAGLNLNVPIIVDEPFIPEKPAKPNKKLTLAIGGVLGIFLGILAVFLSEASDKKIRDSFDIEKLIEKEPLVLTGISDFTNLNFLNDIKTIALNLIKDGKSKTIGVTSVGKVEEKDDITLRLAEFFSSTGNTILIDFEGKYVSRGLKGTDKSNVYNFKENLDVFSVAKTSETSEFLKLVNSFEKDFENIKQNYDYIIFNLPNYENPDVLAFVKYCEKFVLIAKKDVSEKESFLKAYAELKESVVVLKK
ncbi:chain length determinant protein [Thermosipho africanus H17ap60334]|uniref:exopolysaccharide transport family protein n=1 Tax=Thermosipho africanus TaxID=2421 RepID=UPI00028DE56C|nr:exopolysaccharide transport family protein [Thermosipho africanus]EKF48511.1 chain length determinant protein [Thermosipho africanus H17ap60334]